MANDVLEDILCFLNVTEYKRQQIISLIMTIDFHIVKYLINYILSINNIIIPNVNKN
jgi:hypothetical protein